MYERQERIKSLQECLFDCITTSKSGAGERIKFLYWGSAFCIGACIFYLLNDYYKVGFTLFYKITVIIFIVESVSIIYLKIIAFQAQKSFKIWGLLESYNPVDYQGYSQALLTLTSSRSDRFAMVLSWLNHEKHLLENDSRIKNLHT